MAAVSYELIVFYKRASVEKQLNAFTSSKFVLLVLFIDSCLAAAEESLLAEGIPALDEGLTGLDGEVGSLILEQETSICAEWSLKIFS